LAESQSARSWQSKRVRDARLICESRSAKQTDRAGEHDFQVRAQLVGHGDSMGDEVFAGAAGVAQGDGGRGVGQQRVQPCSVGAQGVGKHERVEPVVFVAGRAVASAQVLDLVGADHHDRDTGVEQGVHHRPVRAFDRDLPHAGARQHGEQLAQSGGVVFDRGSHDFAAAAIDDRHRVIITGPVDSACDAVGGFRRQGTSGRLHNSLLAASPSGEAPSCGTGARLLVRSLFGARRRSALSTVGVPRVNAGLRRTHSGHNRCRASRAITQRHLRCIGDPLKITDTRMVHQ
jgi:hypothetical protein